MSACLAYADGLITIEELAMVSSVRLVVDNGKSEALRRFDYECARNV